MRCVATQTDTFRSTQMECHFFLRCLVCRRFHRFGEIEALSDSFVSCNVAKELGLSSDNFVSSPANKIVKENRTFGYRSSMLNLLITFITFSKKVKQSRYRPGVAQRVPGS